MNPEIQYTFQSHRGSHQVTITTRMGQEAARERAMEYFWGPAHGWCENKGLGLDLISVKEVQPS